MAIIGSTGTGLDQLIEIIQNDEGLNRRLSSEEIEAGAAAANVLNDIIISSIKATGVANDGTLSISDVRAISEYINENFQEAFIEAHGNDEDGIETGFHLVQGDGATTQLFGRNAVNKVADGLFHLGFGYEKNRIINEDGDQNASLKNLSNWLNDLLKKDLQSGALTNENGTLAPTIGTTGTGLDQIVEIINNDTGLNRRISQEEIKEGAMAANRMNEMIVEAVVSLGVASDGVFTAADIRSISDYIAENHHEEFLALHGNDEGDIEIGFHLVQGDGARTSLFGKNAINKVADGLYHLVFGYEDGRLTNEDGDANASLAKVANWMNQLLAEDLQSGNLSNENGTLAAIEGTTGTGLDQIITLINENKGLNHRVSQEDIHDGAYAANQMNEIIAEALQVTGAYADNDINVGDVRDLNEYIYSNYQEEWAQYHGDAENGDATGFHLIQGSGAGSAVMGRNAVNKVMDGIYHLGFEIEGNRLVNEDGEANAKLHQVANWLDHFLEQPQSEEQFSAPSTSSEITWVENSIEPLSNEFDFVAIPDIDML